MCDKWLVSAWLSMYIGASTGVNTTHLNVNVSMHQLFQYCLICHESNI